MKENFDDIISIKMNISINFKLKKLNILDIALLIEVVYTLLSPLF